jgi:hypothetical protein
MKKIIIVILAIVVLPIVSCKKYLDVKPEQTFGSNLAVTTLTGLQQTTVGAFNKIQSGNLYGGGIIKNSELLADFVNPNTPVLTDFSAGQEYTHQMNIYNSNAGGMWGDGYSAILIANTVLQYLPNFQSQDPATCNLLKGECLFIRAAMHFELVRMFAQPWGYTSDGSHLGVPIRLVPGTATTYQNVPRSTVAQVYAQVIADLEAAEPLLLASNGIGPDYASKYAAEAMLARVYFSQNDWVDAEKYAGKVISGGFGLSDSLSAPYNVLGPMVAVPVNDLVFQIINTVDNDPSGGNLHGQFSVAPFGSTIPNFEMNAPMAAILQNAQAIGDRRYTSLFKKSFGIYFCTKYSAQYSNTPIVRVEEMYLTRAECEAQTGDNTDARADYNVIRMRAGVPTDNSSAGQGLINAIRGERDLELAMEGDHYFEVKRRQGSFNTPGAGILAWNAQNMIYPIPQQEVQENKAMVQNPGY